MSEQQDAGQTTREASGNDILTGDFAATVAARYKKALDDGMSRENAAEWAAEPGIAHLAIDLAQNGKPLEFSIGYASGQAAAILSSFGANYKKP